jgi:hypothetical protein
METAPIRFYHRWPIRLPGGLVYQFRQWYALGRDEEGVERVGVGATRLAARADLARGLTAIRRYNEQRRGNT